MRKGTGKSRGQRSVSVNILRKLLDEIKENGLDGKALGNVSGEIDSLRQEVRVLSSGMCNYATKYSVDCIGNDIAEIKSLLLKNSSPKNEMQNNCADRVDTSDIGCRQKSTKDRAYQKVNVEDMCHRSGAGQETKYSKMRMMRKRSDSSKAKATRRKLWEQVASDREVERVGSGVSKNSKSLYVVGPFLVTRKVKDEDECLLRYVYDNEGDMNNEDILTVIVSLMISERLVDLNMSSLSRRMFQCLRPRRWLDGEILCAVCELMMLDEKLRNGNCPLFWCLPTRFALVVLSTGLDFCQFCREQNWKERYVFHLPACEKIYIPVLDELRKHWILLVVHVSSAKAEIWDSRPTDESISNRVEICRKLLKALDYFLEGCDREIVGNRSKLFKKFSIILKMDAPQQNNNYDCGLFVVSYLQESALGREVALKNYSHDKRIALALGLFKASLNSSLATVKEKALAKFC